MIETDDQTLESMRVMDNVNSLIGGQGATFTNSFVNYSLCCPSRATFLTGQYMHNHGVLGNTAAKRRLRPLPDPARQTTTSPSGFSDAGYYTAMIGKYLNGYAIRPPSRRAGRSGARRLRGRRRGLRLHAERERHPGQTTARTPPTSSRTC